MQKLKYSLLLFLPVTFIAIAGKINNKYSNGKEELHSYSIATASNLINRSAKDDTSNPIHLNQLGFYPHAPKKAIITGNKPASKFYIISTDYKDTIYQGVPGPIKQSSNSSLSAMAADFSACSKKGKYLLDVPGVGKSYQFTIEENVHHAVAIASLKGYYFQRASMPLEPKFAGKWSRPAGHPDTAVLIHPSAASVIRKAGTVISTPGGWYDAGDYNKYIVNSGITMGTLLSAYEDFPEYFNKLNTNIPESNDAIPDILNEIIYNLRWMLSMQDPGDGGVYNKCTNASFDGMVMPGVTKAPRYVVAKGTAATLDFSAVMAQSARILKKFDKPLPGLSDSCKRAAISAWTWAMATPSLAYDQNSINKLYEPKIITGGYGDSKFNDEWFWAAVELFITTKDNQFRSVMSSNKNVALSLPGWGNVQMLGYYSLLRNGKFLPKDMTDDLAMIKSRLIQFDDNYVVHLSDNAFETVMGESKRDFNWGSNSNAVNQGIALIYGYVLTNDKKYLDAALSNLDYIFGRNATGYCFVTGQGSFSSKHPHHRWNLCQGYLWEVPTRRCRINAAMNLQNRKQLIQIRTALMHLMKLLLTGMRLWCTLRTQ
ncbi:MAG: glycoside hydrolase family 9 protein [Chitinophagaceae bacterium]